MNHSSKVHHCIHWQKNYFFDPTIFLGRANKNSFLVTNSEIWQKSSKGTNNLGTTFFVFDWHNWKFLVKFDAKIGLFDSFPFKKYIQ